MSDQNSVASPETTRRNYGIDALRILAMFMVILLHLLGQGGVLERAEWMSSQYKAAWFLEVAAFCAVNCYALISGYVGTNGKYKYYNIVLLWLRVVFWTLCITLLFSIFAPGTVTMKDWAKALLPVSEGYYWYFTAYFALFFLIPFLNAAMDKLTREQLRALVISFVIIFSGIQTLFSWDIFSTAANVWWLMLLYVMGSYIRRYGLCKKSSTGVLFLGYLGMTVLTWLSKMLIEAGMLPFLNRFGSNYLVNNTSPTILASAVFLLLLFERIQTSRLAEKIIRFFAPMAFSVYLIHANPFVWDYLLTRRFEGYAECSVWLELLLVLVTAAGIYVLCSLLDLIRAGIFKGLKLKQHLAKAEEKYIGKLWN